MPALFNILASVEKPFRYLGGEVGACKKNWDEVSLRLCLAFPDTYEMGMSNLGLSILYAVVNERPDMLAERVFAPWPDMEDQLLNCDVPLFSLESKRPLREFDVLGISLPYELSYTNILTILTLAKIPWRACDRDDSFPLIVGGGPCAFNPEPVAEFFDAIVIGDGEKVLIEMMEIVRDAKTKGLPKSELVKHLSELTGVYVPSLKLPKTVNKALIDNLEDAPYPHKPVVPYAAVHYRACIEVSRGCTRGCRFCQAGFVYRPARHRSLEKTLDLTLKQLAHSGHEDFSFLALSVGDYPCLEPLLQSVHDLWKGSPVNAQMPSLRVESLSDQMMGLLGRSRSGSFTLAPEAATERMRKKINKGNTDEDLYSSIEKIFSSGWHQVKLYFMIGLPDETKEELEGIVHMANRCLDIGKRYHHKAEVTVSTSTFIPKPHTPFQWVKQVSVEETLEKQSYLKRHLTRRGLYYRWHNPHMSFLEGVFSRGDCRLSKVIENAHHSGARFDAWDERFDFARWMDAFADVGINPADYLGERDRAAPFPWDHLYTDLKKEYLFREYDRSLSGIPTPDCMRQTCQGCGVCKDLRRETVDHRPKICDRINPPTPPFSKGGTLQSPPLRKGGEGGFEHVSRYRVQLTKTGLAAFLGHLEFMNVIRRAFRRAGLPLRYSEGFHPHAKISFGKALSIGLESECEFCDVELLEAVDPSEMMVLLESVFPVGIRCVSVGLLEQNASSIEQSISVTNYEIYFPGVPLSPSPSLSPLEGEGTRCLTPSPPCPPKPWRRRVVGEGWGEGDLAISNFNAASTWPFLRRRGEKTANVDLKHYVSGLVVNDQGVIGLTLNEKEPMIRVSEALQSISRLSEEMLRYITIRKTGVIFKT